MGSLRLRLYPYCFSLYVRYTLSIKFFAFTPLALYRLCPLTQRHVATSHTISRTRFISFSSYSTFFQGVHFGPLRAGRPDSHTVRHIAMVESRPAVLVPDRGRGPAPIRSLVSALSVGPAPESAVSGTRACRLLTVTRSHLPPPVPDTCHTSRAKTTATDRESLRIVDRPVECVAVRRPPSDSRPHGPHLFDVLIPQCRQPRQRVRC